MQACTVSALQLSVVPMDVVANMRKIHDHIERCVEMTQSKLIVLPESVTTGFTPVGGLKALYDVVDWIPGKLTDEVITWAKKFKTTIVFPTYERIEGTSLGVYNSAVIIDETGILGVYRKTHPFVNERIGAEKHGFAPGWTTPGSKPLCVQTPLGRIGIVVCYDGDFPELARITALQGAEIICRPSAFMRTFDHWELTNRARAYDNHVYWVATNAVGLDASGAHFFGGSMICDPTGFTMSRARASDEFCFAKLDPDPIKRVSPGSSVRQTFDHLQDRNIDAYADILNEANSPFEPSQRVPYLREKQALDALKD